MARLRKTLPKDFTEILRRGDLDEQIAVFDSRIIDAHDGYDHRTALALDDCSEDLTRWLIEHGADLEARDRYGCTPLINRAARGSVAGLIEAGADVGASGDWHRGTALRQAARAFNTANVRALIEAGADQEPGSGPQLATAALQDAVDRANNADLPRLAVLVRMLLTEGAVVTEQVKESTTRLGESFEFTRAVFNPDFVDEHSAALDDLYALLDVPPVPRRRMHDGTEPIVLSGDTPQEKFESAWELLVPAKGSAATAQGEIVRVAGRIRDEILRNGGGNWDRHYRSMREALPRYAAAGTPLDDAQLAELAALSRIPSDDLGTGPELDRMCELAVAWVERNPEPFPAPAHTYRR